jgi:hypothetical protein
MTSEKFSQAIAEIDAANACDPSRISSGADVRPAALVYGERMSAVLDRLYPDASEILRIAARAQHIQRWTIPRSDYPMDRAGYLKWRTDLKNFHAGVAGRIMERAGYGADAIARVQSLLRKENLKRDPEAQALEDTACIVFLEFYAPEFMAKHDDAKLIPILRKTWAKMSVTGRNAALALELQPRVRTLVGAALSNS